MNLSDISTRPPKGINKAATKKKTDNLARKIAEIQHLLYAEGKKSVLIVFQGMDSSGKDGATKKVFKYCSPSAISAFPFKKPTEEEFGHDFLWRVHKLAPQKGQMVIFNRSHYEDILVQRVHKWINEDRVKMRIEAINAWETLLIKDNNTTIIKFVKKRNCKKVLMIPLKTGNTILAIGKRENYGINIKNATKM
jgi:polyphosphate kinase 2 (PPK2 family)